MKTWRHSTVALLLAALLASLVLTACGGTVKRTIDDADVTTAVKTALLNDPDIGGLRIDVETTDHVVTLSGQVRTAADSDKAVAIAKSAKGVASVKSSLQVQ